MIPKDELKAYLRFLDQASKDELIRRQKHYVKLLNQLTDEEVIRDTRYLLRLLEEELRARIIIEELRKKPRR